MGILRFELPDFSVGAPLPVAIPGVPHVGPGDPVEPATRVETRGDFEGERLVVHEAVVARRTNGLLVEKHRVAIASLDACDLRRHQEGAVCEVLGAVPGPSLELLMMRNHGCEVWRTSA